MYAGKDPITQKQTYLRGEVRRSRADAEADKERLFALCRQRRDGRAGTRTASPRGYRQVAHGLDINDRGIVDMVARQQVSPGSVVVDAITGPPE